MIQDLLQIIVYYSYQISMILKSITISSAIFILRLCNLTLNLKK